MTKNDFVRQLAQSKKALVRKYMLGPTTNPEDFPWEVEHLYIQEFKGQVVIIALNDGSWPEIDPRDGDCTFDGTKMICAVEDYGLEFRLIENGA